MDPITLAILGSSLVSAGASVGGSIYSNYKNSQNVDKQNRYNLDMWRMTNDYNSPINQVKRLREAGINPAIALGNITPGTAQGVTSAVHQPTINPLQDLPNIVGNGISQSMQFDLMKKQKEQIASTIRLNNANADKQVLENDFISAEKKETINNLKADTSVKYAQADNLDANTAKADAETKFINQQASQAVELYKQQIKLNDATIDEIKSRTALNNSQISLNEDDLKNMRPMQRAVMSSTISLNASVISLNHEKTLNESETRLLIKKNVQLMSEQIYSQEIQNGVDAKTATIKVKQAIQSLKNSKEMFNLLVSQVGLNDAKKYREYIGSACDVVNTGVNVGSAIATGGLSNIGHGTTTVNNNSGSGIPMSQNFY